MLTNKLLPYLIGIFTLMLNGKVIANTFQIIPNVYHFNYEEFSEIGTSINHETGYLPGIKLKLTHAMDVFTFTPYISFHDGKVDYTGGTQSGQPHTTKTEEKLTQLGFEISSTYIESISGRLLFGARHWEWDRNILDNNNILGLHEIYTWNELSIGLNFETKINNNAFYWSIISALHTYNPEMVIFLPNSKETLKLGSSPGFRVHAGKSWIYNKDKSYSLSVISEYWEFGKSSAVFTNDFFGQSTFIHEPRSESIHIGIEFSFNFHF